MKAKINNFFLKIFNVDEWVGENKLFLNKKDGLIYESVCPLMISGTPGLKFYSFIQPSTTNFSMHTAIEKSDLRYFRRLNEKEEIAFNAKFVLSKK